MNVGFIPLFYPLVELQKEVSDLIEQYPIDGHYNQLCLTHRAGADNQFYEGLGSLYDFEKKKFNSFESEYGIINEGLQGSLLEQVIQDVWKWSPLGRGRVRLMRLSPKSCLSFHADENIRFHLPIFSNPQALFFFSDGPPMGMPATGQMYWMDALKGHTAINGDNNQDRIHIVFATSADHVTEHLAFLNRLRGMKNEAHSSPSHL